MASEKTLKRKEDRKREKPFWNSTTLGTLQYIDRIKGTVKPPNKERKILVKHGTDKKDSTTNEPTDKGYDTDQ